MFRRNRKIRGQEGFRFRKQYDDDNDNDNGFYESDQYSHVNKVEFDTMAGWVDLDVYWDYDKPHAERRVESS